MSKKRRRYSREFKVEAIRLVREEHMKPTQVARDLGIAESSLNRWVAADREKASPDGSPTPEERSEIRQLRRRVRELEMEREILKKAAAFFAREIK